MMLILVQHGDALPKESDPDRPLSDAGQRDVQGLVEFLIECGISVSRVIHSGKTRARQTAELLGSALAPGKDIDAHSGLDPNDPTQPFAEEVLSWEDDVLVVGHLPFMDKLVARLVAGNEDRSIVTIRPGAMVCLERTEASDWRVTWMVRPELFA